MSSPDGTRDSCASDTLVLSNHQSVVGETTIQQNSNHDRYAWTTEGCLRHTTGDVCTEVCSNPSLSPGKDLFLDLPTDNFVGPAVEDWNSLCVEQEEFGDFCFSPVTTPAVSLLLYGQAPPVQFCEGSSEVGVGHNIFCDLVEHDTGLRDVALRSGDTCSGSCNVEQNVVDKNAPISTEINSTRSHSDCFTRHSVSGGTNCDETEHKTCSKRNGFCLLNQHNPPQSNGQQSEKEGLRIQNSVVHLVQNGNPEEFTKASTLHLGREEQVVNYCMPMMPVENNGFPSDRLTDNCSEEFDEFKEAVVDRTLSSAACSVSCVADGHSAVESSNWAVFDDPCNGRSMSSSCNGFNSEIDQFNIDNVSGPPVVGEDRSTECVSSLDHSSHVTQSCLSADVIVKTIKKCFDNDTLLTDDSLLTDDTLLTVAPTNCGASLSVSTDDMLRQHLLSSRMSDDVVWNGMNVLENTAALKHHWAGSHAQSLVLSALSVNPSNILTKPKTTGATLLTRRGK